MKVLRTIQIRLGKKYHSLSFGVPTTNEELEEMFCLRYKVYVLENRYGDKKNFPEEKEYDTYDIKKKCKYFIAILDGKIVGAARLILTDLLPVEKDYFKFQKPPAIKKIPRRKIMEVSRVISRPHKFIHPRHLIILGLFDSILKFCFNNDIQAAYAVIEQPLKEKLEKLKFPFYLIENLRIRQSSLTKKFPRYFSKKNKLYLIYFFRNEVDKYLRKIMNNELLKIDR